MDIEYIIVQAGGKGTRLEYLTENKPKALVPIENRPMIFHLFAKYPDKKFIIIGDYKKEVFKEYLRCFAPVQYLFIEAKGERTCGGLQQALAVIPEGTPFLYIWSDLILADSVGFPEKDGTYIGISGDFECRWSYRDDKFLEEKSCEDGIAGYFIFQDKSEIADVPESGAFVRYLQQKNKIFKRFMLNGTREYGLLSEYKKLKTEKCRPFNSMELVDDKLIKRGIDEQGRSLAKREAAWYKKAAELGYTRTPHIYEFAPLVMERIHGKNIYECKELSKNEKQEILRKLTDNLRELHGLATEKVNLYSVHEAYIQKTFDRLSKIRDLLPFANEKYINVNGKQCRNIFFFKNELEAKVMNYAYHDFCFIHGDCTFSNMMLSDEGEPVLIDPRGYFGFTELYGDPDYDWAKLYYSLRGNYDQFNLKNFRLKFIGNQVELHIESNGWEEVADDIFSLVPELNEEKIKLLHAIIWLSLTTYAWQDYDSICGAFYNGLYYLEDVL